MTDDLSALDNLRPEVREAMTHLENYLHITIGDKHFRSTDYDTIRAELLRLTEALHLADGVANLAMQHRDSAEAELAALKARIADAPVAYLTSKTGVGPCNVASMAHGVVFDSSSYGKSVRVVLDE